MARSMSFPPLHLTAPTPILFPPPPSTSRLFPFLLPARRKIQGHSTRTRAISEWQEYEAAVKEKDLARALRFLKDVPLELDNSSIDELGLLGLGRNWEVLDTCLNADDLMLVGGAYAFLQDRGFLPNFGKYRNIGKPSAFFFRGVYLLFPYSQTNA